MEPTEQKLEKSVVENPFAARMNIGIALLAIGAIVLSLVLRYAIHSPAPWFNVPLFIAFGLGGSPLLFNLIRAILRGKFGSDLLAGISIVTAVLLGEYLAGTLVVLMLSGGEALEEYAVKRASSVLRALAKRVPSVAHRKNGETVTDIEVSDIKTGDMLVILPHEISPADAVVVEGHGAMDESYLTGEPYQIVKAPGSEILSGAVNGDTVLTAKASREPRDSRYAKIMGVMKESEQSRPQLRRIGDALGAWYTPLAVGIAIIAALVARDPMRFLAVLVVATPCPLLIAIPVAIIGSISLAAKRGIIIKDPTVLEQLPTVKTIFFDKTGTLTFGEPRLTEILPVPDVPPARAISLAASIALYSRHPLSRAIGEYAKKNAVVRLPVVDLSEPAGKGLSGKVDGHEIKITSRKNVLQEDASKVPPIAPGLECVLLIDGRFGAMLRFRDEPRDDVGSFIKHLGPHHAIRNLILLTGDRKAEADHLAARVGIKTVYADKSPEEKLAIVKAETTQRRTAYLGDGINDAPSLLAATVGIAFGKATDITAEAASAVILDSSLRKLDEFFHIAMRLRRIVLESAVGGMSLSLIAVGFAAAGFLPPVAGAVLQEAIDVVAVLNALRAAFPPREMSDM